MSGHSISSVIKVKSIRKGSNQNPNPFLKTNREITNKSLRIFPDTQGQLTSQSLLGSCKISRYYGCPHHLQTRRRSDYEWSQNFPNYNPIEAICCLENQSSDPILPKTYCSLSYIPMMLQIQFHCKCPLASEIFMLEIAHTHRRRDERQLDYHPISSPCEPSAQMSLKS